MTRLAWTLALAAAVGCSDDDEPMMMEDAGVDAGEDDTDAGRDGGMPPRDVGTDTGPEGCTEGCEIVELEIGAVHACARRDNGEVLCWGGNRFGQLGDNRMLHGSCSDSGGGPEVEDCTPTPQVVLDISADWISTNGGFNTCAGVDGALYCWGLEVIPPVGSDQRARLFLAEEVEQFDDVVIGATSGSFQCVVTSTGAVECRGDNSASQLGNGTGVESFDAVAVMGLTGAVDVVTASGGEHVCARTATAVYCWGADRSGQLGIDGMTTETCGPELMMYGCASMAREVTGLTGVEQLALGAEHTCARKSDGTLSCWGANFAGQLGLGHTDAGIDVPTDVAGLTGVEQVVAGYDHTCALLAGGDVKCFGRNDEGQLGDGEDVGAHDSCTASSTTVDCSAVAVDVDLPGSATLLAAGSSTSCALVDGDVYCWGYNDQRQIGQQDRMRRTTPVKIEGLE